MRQPVVAVVAEPRGRVGPAAQQPVQGGGGQRRQPVAVGRRERVDFELHRLQQPRGGLPGRRGQRDAQCPTARAPVEFGLLGQQREQPGDGGGLAGARSAGEHGQRAVQRHLGRGALLGVAVGEEPGDVGRGSGSRRGGQCGDVGGDAALLDPVAVQIEQPGVEVQHRRFGQHPAGLDRGQPLAGCGPRQLRRAGLLLDRREVHAHRPAAQRAHHERHRQRDPLVGFVGQLGQPAGHQHVGGLQRAGVVEDAQQPVRRGAAAPVGRVEGRLGGDGHAAARRPSKRSESAPTNSADGRQLKTPAGCPSVTGVSGPHIPRTNR